MCIEVTSDTLRYKAGEGSISMGSCVLLLLQGSRGSMGLISLATKIWAGSDESLLGELWSLFPLGCNVMLGQEPFAVYSGNLTKPPLSCRTELLEELQPGKKNQDSFVVDFRVRIASVPLLGCKLYHFRGRKCAQSLKVTQELMQLSAQFL